MDFERCIIILNKTILHREGDYEEVYQKIDNYIEIFGKFA